MQKVTINGVEYTPFESGASFNSILTDGKKFIVLSEYGHNCPKGKIVKFKYQRNNWYPYMIDDNGTTYCIRQEQLAYYDEPVKKSEPLKNTIITNIKDEAQHKRVQEKLFGMGKEWHDGKVVHYERGETELVVRGEGSWIMFSPSPESRQRCKHITADEFLGEDKIITTDLSNGCDVSVFQVWKGNADGKLELISTSANGIELLNNTPTDTPKPIAKGNKIMSNIVSFFNDLTVSAEDKELRKAGLKDGELNYTSEAREIVLNLEAKERGYKSYSDLREKIGYDRGSNASVTNLEMDALFTKFYSKLLETAKKFNKREEKK